jgi:hypothetical protein
LSNGDFDIIFSEVDETTDAATITNYGDKVQQYEDNRILAALQKFNPNAQQYSAYTKDLTKADDVTLDTLDTLATDAHNTLDNVLRLNAMIRKTTVLNSFVGKTVESIFSNCNTDYRLVFPDAEGRNKKKTLDQAKLVIDDFLQQIRITNFIRDVVPMTYCEGNRYYYLRVEGGNYVLDYLPLGVVYMSDYNVDGRPALEMNLKKLETGLKKTYQTDKKKKAIWMKDVEEDIKRNYPYVYTQWKAGETYARLDVKYAKAVRINNLGRKFGISPLAKVLKDIVVLDNLSKADVTTSKMKQRTLIVQLLRKEVLDTNGQKKGIVQTDYAHQSLMAALATTASVYTAAPFVEEVKYVTPPSEDNTKEKAASYTKALLMGLGIGFVDTEAATATGSKLSLEELMKLVNAIVDQVNDLLNDYFKVVLENNNIPLEYCPTIQIMDSKAMDFDMKKDLSDFLFNKLSCSYETAYEVLGLADYATERSRRETENGDKTEEIFKPHATAFNSNGGESDSPGRPTSKTPENEDKQKTDKVNNDAK